MEYNKITISGKICAGKTTLLKSLQKKLKWPTFQTGQLFRDYVLKHKLSLEGADEQNNKFTKEVDGMVKKMLHSQGNLIVDGWMSGISANDQKDVLKILLVCKDKIRYKRFAEREEINVNKAKNMVEERQNNWFSKIKKIHKINSKEFTNEKNYDLVIDTSVITPLAVLKMVLNVL
jgi:cytidylate kinase